MALETRQYPRREDLRTRPWPRSVDWVETEIPVERMLLGMTPYGAHYGAITQVGKRERQEDGIVVHSNRDTWQTRVCVIDGIHSARDGDVATHIFGNVMSHIYRTRYQLHHPSNRARYAQQHLAVSQDLTHEDSGVVYAEMCLCPRGRIEVDYMGDVQAAHFDSGGRLVECTQPHREKDGRGVTRAVTHQQYDQVEKKYFRRQSRHVYILASDGLWDSVSPAVISEILQVTSATDSISKRVQEIVRRLNTAVQVQQANLGEDQGDNYTLFVSIEP
ncbi:protein phosphatase 2C family protein [Candidatus Woesebacteria bacterium]|nr:protein phosphatase 2C family protein [Candidatus Woesebacteria bacterium]MCD8507309.1 protein phosphatase 2C family protein [Candidatus Woesebacteria bacterium]MCD8527003.1 protein phosphatase 2C family protein [Candidatus Woesebacteria bacterium]MCD8546757.1 protein phosphatase 2C family protein [Candidatus Woesebacteria bacterium]